MRHVFIRADGPCFRSLRRAVLALMLGLTAGLTGGLPARAEPVLNIGNGPAPDTLDPHQATSVVASNILRELFEGLLTRNSKGELIPGAAESWTVSADGLQYDFKLRADAKWSDGSPVTAADWVFSWRRAVDPATRPSYTNLLYSVQNAAAIVRGEAPPESLGVSAPDPLTFRVRLDRPDINMLNYTSHQATMPVHPPSLAQHGAEWLRPGNLVSNGPYRLTAAVPQSHVRLEKNPHFHAAAGVRIPVVQFHVTEDQNTEVKRFRAGELHVTERVADSMLDFVQENLPGSLRVHPMARVRFINMNLTLPKWQDVRVRRALYLAIDREALVKALKAGDLPAYTMIPPGLEGYRRPPTADQLLTQAQRDAEAKRLLAEAGYGPGGKKLPVTLMHSSQEAQRRQAVAVAAMWKQKLGVEVVLDNQEFRVTIQRHRVKDYDTTQRAWRSYTGAYALENFRERDPSSNPGFADPAFEALMTKAETALDQATADDFLRQSEDLLVREAATIPYLYEASRRLVCPCLEGYEDNIMDIHPARWMAFRKE